MGWLINRDETKVKEMKEALLASFDHVKADVQNLQSWIHHLNQQNTYQQQVIDHLRAQVTQLRTQKFLTREEIKDLIDRYYSLDPIVDRVEKLEKELTQKPAIQPQEANLSPIMNKLAEISAKITSAPSEKPAKPISHLKQKVVREVARRSKDYVKNVMHNLVQKYTKTSGLQLREIVVEEQKLVSKSSFYRLLQELEDEGKITVTQRGKEKVYSSSTEPVEMFK